MTKAVRVTNTDPTNSAKVTTADGHAGPYHVDVLAPGGVKTVSPIGSGGSVRVEPVSVTVSVSVENLSATDALETIKTDDTQLAPGDTASFAMVAGRAGGGLTIG